MNFCLIILLILFLNDEGRTNLDILADSQENDTNLFRLLVTGSLDVCLVIDHITVCQQDSVLSIIILEETDLGSFEELPIAEYDFPPYSFTAG